MFSCFLVCYYKVHTIICSELHFAKKKLFFFSLHHRVIRLLKRWGHQKKFYFRFTFNFLQIFFYYFYFVLTDIMIPPMYHIIPFEFPRIYFTVFFTPNKLWFENREQHNTNEKKWIVKSEFSVTTYNLHILHPHILSIYRLYIIWLLLSLCISLSNEHFYYEGLLFHEFVCSIFFYIYLILTY